MSRSAPDSFVHVFLSPQQSKWIRRQSDDLGLSPSQFIRFLIQHWVRVEEDGEGSTSMQKDWTADQEKVGDPSMPPSRPDSNTVLDQLRQNIESLERLNGEASPDAKTATESQQQTVQPSPQRSTERDARETSLNDRTASAEAGGDGSPATDHSDAYESAANRSLFEIARETVRPSAQRSTERDARETSLNDRTASAEAGGDGSPATDHSDAYESADNQSLFEIAQGAAVH